MMENNNEQIVYEKLCSLSPDDNYESSDAEVYYQYLDQVINNDSMKNIAITGSFGIGKSTILQSYNKNRDANIQFFSVLDLWLTENSENLSEEKIQEASDNEEQNSSKQSSNNKRSSQIQSLIEQNLLKQLLSRCSHKELPASSLKLVPEDNGIWSIVKNILFSLYVSIITFLIFFIIFADKFSDKVRDFTYEILKPIGIYEILSMLIVPLVVYGTYKILSQFKLSKLAVNSKVAEGEFERTQDENYTLDLNLSELIYVFEKIKNKKSNVIIFEDLDRFSYETCLSIFAKLRQLNVMVNNRVDMKHKKKLFNKEYRYLKFIYVCQDDIFLEGNNTYKFFDVVIPIVPSLSIYNGKTYFVDQWYGEKFDHKFLNEVSPYLTDYRIQKNIKNEYFIFKNIYCSRNPINCEHKNYIPFNSDECLAFVIFKNLFPKEYSKIKRKDAIKDCYDSDLINFLQKTQVPVLEIEKILFSKMTIDTFRLIGFNPVQELKNYNMHLLSRMCRSAEAMDSIEHHLISDSRKMINYIFYIYEDFTSKKLDQKHITMLSAFFQGKCSVYFYVYLLSLAIVKLSNKQDISKVMKALQKTLSFAEASLYEIPYPPIIRNFFSFSKFETASEEDLNEDDFYKRQVELALYLSKCKILLPDIISDTDLDVWMIKKLKNGNLTIFDIKSSKDIDINQFTWKKLSGDINNIMLHQENLYQTDVDKEHLTL